MVTRQARLPGEPHYVRQAVWNSTDRGVTAFALTLPAALTVIGLVFTSSVAWTGGIATAVTGAFLLVLWSLETRTVAIGEGWLAVKARLAPSWVVVPVADIVSVRRRRFIKSGLAVRLTSGPPVFVRRGDLEDGIAAAMSDDLGLRSPIEAALAELMAEQEAAAAAAGGGDEAEQIAVALAPTSVAETPVESGGRGAPQPAVPGPVTAPVARARPDAVVPLASDSPDLVASAVNGVATRGEARAGSSAAAQPSGGLPPGTASSGTATAWPRPVPLRRRAGDRTRHEWSAFLRRWSSR